VVHAIVDCVEGVRHLWAGLLNFVFDEMARQRSHSALDSQSIFGTEFFVDFAGGGSGRGFWGFGKFGGGVGEVSERQQRRFGVFFSE
jgi:hypothetical protein